MPSNILRSTRWKRIHSARVKWKREKTKYSNCPWYNWKALFAKYQSYQEIHFHTIFYFLILFIFFRFGKSLLSTENTHNRLIFFAEFTYRYIYCFVMSKNSFILFLASALISHSDWLKARTSPSSQSLIQYAICFAEISFFFVFFSHWDRDFWQVIIHLNDHARGTAKITKENE